MSEEYTLDQFIADLAVRLDPRARAEFREIEQLILRRSMEAVGMRQYPPLRGDAAGDRAGGDCLCETCGKEFGAHPMDWRVIGYGDVPFLNVLCDGRRVKL